MITIFEHGAGLVSQQIPAEWNTQVVLKLDSGAMTFSFNNGDVLVEQQEASDAEAIIELSDERACSYIDGTIDFMTVWRELAEPSPTDRTYIKKGSGAKFFTVVDAIIKQYKKDNGFKQMLDAYKAGL